MIKVKSRSMVKSKVKAAKPHRAASGSPAPAHAALHTGVHTNLPDDVGAVLTINLDALIANYRKLTKMSGRAECAAVVKANAYGIGDREVVRALVKQGCKTLFVANLKEATRARRTSRKPDIYVLDGFHPDSKELYLKHRLRPVLNSLDDIKAWSAFANSVGTAPEAAIHLDTGMNRLGLPEYEIRELSNNPQYFEHFEPALIMSHFACADDPTHPMNRLQKSLFDQYCQRFPGIRLSMANSAGVTLGTDFHYDMTRVGLALYGGEPSLKSWLDLKPVVTLHARILQIHEVPAGETIGYGATHTFTRPSRIATLSAGYADGIFRILGSSLAQSPSYGHFKGQKLAILGRISMDLITCDITGLDAGKCRTGDWIELIGPDNTVNDIARRARTNAYEVLTALGPRYHRIYTQGKS